MRLYSGSSTQFIQDTTQNQIADKLTNAFLNNFRYKPSPNEINSWRNSLRALSLLFHNANILDHGVILEYQLPLSSRRLDCIVCGKDDDLGDNAVIIELKQWEKCKYAECDNEVLTWVGGAEREVLHPSVQVGQYKMYLEDTHPAFYDGQMPIKLNACAYLHNYTFDLHDAISASKFDDVMKMYPLYTADDTENISNYLIDNIGKGQGMDILKRIEESKFRPSKNLMDHVGVIIKENSEYILLDEQLVAYDKVLSAAKKGFHDKQKTVIIIRGGPGTGKSVIAINLMADLLLNGYNTYYSTGSKAFTETLRRKVGQRGSIQFKYFNSFINTEYNEIDVLICDESHRIRDTSDNRFTKKEDRSNKKQIEELLFASKVSVFFIDDDQIVRPNEIGSVDLIRKYAEQCKCKIFVYELEIQFRCGGCEGFINWINNTLALKKTANILWTGSEDFDFKIFNSPEEPENAIKIRSEEGYSARLAAGFCWKWSKKPKSDGTLQNDVIIGDFKRPWNANPSATRLARNIPKASYWATDPNGINQIGCVYTAQGFEFDYIGIIFGTDLVYNLDEQQWVGNKKNSEDTVVKRSKDKFTKLVQDTYRVLLTRGMKGCYVCFMDKDTERFVKSRIEI